MIRRPAFRCARLPYQPIARDGIPRGRRRSGVSDLVRLRAGGDVTSGTERRAGAGDWCVGRISIRKGRRRFIFDDGRKSDVTPIRFVCACDKGHLQDIEWRWVVHGAVPCQEPMWVEEKGTSADPADTSIVCGCGRRLSLQDTFQPGRLGKCRGDRPWLLDRDPDGCGDNLKLLTRTATNTYFPQVYTVISLPSEEDELSRLVDELSGDLARGPDGAGRRASEALQSQGFRDRSALMRTRKSSTACSASGTGRGSMPADRRNCPSSILSQAGARKSADNNPAAKLYAQTLPRDVWADAGCRDRPFGNQEPRRRSSPEGGVLPLWVHALRGGADGCRWRASKIFN